MNYRLLLTGTFLMAGVFVFAQNRDAKASSLLEEVSRKAKACKSIKTDFSYTMENAKAGINEEKTGTLLISGDKYRMTASGQTVICDGKTIWTYIKESNEVQVNTLENKDEALTPSKLLTSYNANYKSRIVKSSDPAIENVELTPNKVKNVTHAILGIDKMKKQVKSFTLFDKSGNTFRYKIKTYLTDTPVTDADFTFDAKKFPGVEVIDMR
ncbi:MAG TPA: outer membrane lipoprotein carrier protein LolA [Bacteroidales bacterium]|nr:outer membrane lipoprotein carrier protein LolA [Bacteroidales bacterium]HPS62437.1 outer membrane lipoprotein carrier protein LolA [Bacteroidales bacterium]